MLRNKELKTNRWTRFLSGDWSAEVCRSRGAADSIAPRRDSGRPAVGFFPCGAEILTSNPRAPNGPLDANRGEGNLGDYPVRDALSLSLFTVLRFTDRRDYRMTWKTKGGMKGAERRFLCMRSGTRF